MTKTTFKIIQGAIILGSTIQLGHGAEPTKPRDDTWKVSELSTRELAPHIKEAILGHKNKKGEKDGFSIYRVSEKLNDVPQNRIAIKFDNNEFSRTYEPLRSLGDLFTGPCQYYPRTISQEPISSIWWEVSGLTGGQRENRCLEQLASHLRVPREDRRTFINYLRTEPKVEAVQYHDCPLLGSARWQELGAEEKQLKHDLESFQKFSLPTEQTTKRLTEINSEFTDIMFVETCYSI